MTQKARKLLSLALYVVPIFMLLVLLHNVHSEWENAENIKYSMFSRQNTDFSNEVQLRIEGILTERLNDLALLSGIIDHMSGQERLEEFSQSAAGVVQREQSFHVLNYISPDSIILASVPEGKRPELIGLDLKTLPGRADLHRRVQTTGLPLASPPLMLTTGEPGIVIWFPVGYSSKTQSRSLAMLAGTIQLDTLFQEAVRATTVDDFELTILIDQTEVFRSGTDAPVVEDIVSRKSFSIAGRNFTVICQPLMMGSFQSVSQNNRNHFYHGIGSSTFAALSLLLMVILIHRNQIQKFHLKEKQMELISQWDLMTDLFEGVPIGMTLWEADGSLSMANACFMSMIGYSLEEVDTLEKWHHLAHPDPEYRDQVLKEWQEDRGVPAETKDLCKIPSVRERQVTCKDGSIKIIEFRAAFFANNTALVALTDITKRKVTEMAREELISELERFTYTVSHDLKSPIITIKGFLGKLAHDIENENRESIQKDIERIDIAATRMNHLLDELLNLSRIGRLGLTLEEVNLDEAVAEVIETLHSQVSEADGSIRVEGQLPTVMAISVRIREVFQNIIENSLKFTRQGVAPEIEIGSRLESGKTVFYVKDNGIGIDPRYHDKIFNLFEQLEPDKRGTGIGLTVVKRIIKHHNGSIWVESDGESAGSTFYFTLS